MTRVEKMAPLRWPEVGKLYRWPGLPPEPDLSPAEALAMAIVDRKIARQLVRVMSGQLFEVIA
jgi:hypothetical protein